MYLDLGKVDTNSFFYTPPIFWTTAEVTVGLLAACLPPLNPLIKRVPSPRKVYDFLINTFTSPSSGRSNAIKRLSSVEDVPRADGPGRGKTKMAGDAGIQMEGVDIAMKEDAGFSRAV